MAELKTREEILAVIAARKREVEKIEVPEWGGTVYVKRLTTAELQGTGFFAGDTQDPAGLQLRVIAASVSDENGEPLFAVEDVAALKDADFSATLRVFAEAARVNGFSNKELEEAVATFVAAQREDSSSD